MELGATAADRGDSVPPSAVDAVVVGHPARLAAFHEGVVEGGGEHVALGIAERESPLTCASTSCRDRAPPAATNATHRSVIDQRSSRIAAAWVIRPDHRPGGGLRRRAPGGGTSPVVPRHDRSMSSASSAVTFDFAIRMPLAWSIVARDAKAAVRWSLRSRASQ